MSERVDDIHFNMPEQDVILLTYALTDYRGIFKKECETGRRLDKIIRILDLAIDHKFLSPEKKEEQ